MLSQFLRSRIASKGVERDTEERGFKRRVALRQKPYDDAGKHVAAPRSSHSAIAPRANVFSTIWRVDVGWMTFEDKYRLVLLCKLLRMLVTCHPAVFCRMRRKNAQGRQKGEQRVVDADSVECIGINHAGHVASLYQLVTKRIDGTFVGAYSRAYCNRIVSVGVYSLCKELTIDIMMHNSFGHTNLHYIVVALRNVCRDLPYSTPQTSFESQHASSTHTILARYNESVAEGAFVAFSRTMAEDAAEIRKRKCRGHYLDDEDNDDDEAKYFQSGAA